MKTTVRTVGQVSVVDLSGKITIGEGDVILRDKVLRPSGKVEDLLQLTKLWEVFEIFNEEAPAVGSF